MDIQFPSQWHCTFTDNGVLDTGSDCTVTATTTYHTDVNVSNLSTTTASSTTPYGDWLFVNALILFCVAFIPVNALFSIMKTKK